MTPQARICRTCSGPMVYREDIKRWVCEQGHQELPYERSDEG